MDGACCGDVMDLVPFSIDMVENLSFCIFDGSVKIIGREKFHVKTVSIEKPAIFRNMKRIFHQSFGKSIDRFFIIDP